MKLLGWLFNLSFAELKDDFNSISFSIFAQNLCYFHTQLRSHLLKPSHLLFYLSLKVLWNSYPAVPSIIKLCFYYYDHPMYFQLTYNPYKLHCHHAFKLSEFKSSSLCFNYSLVSRFSCLSLNEFSSSNVLKNWSFLLNQ